MYVSLKIAGIPADAIGELHAQVKQCVTVNNYIDSDGGGPSIGHKLSFAKILKSEMKEGGTYTVEINIDACQRAKNAATENDRPREFFPKDYYIFAPSSIFTQIFNAIDPRLFPPGIPETVELARDSKPI